MSCSCARRSLRLAHCYASGARRAYGIAGLRHNSCRSTLMPRRHSDFTTSGDVRFSQARQTTAPIAASRDASSIPSELEISAIASTSGRPSTLVDWSEHVVWTAALQATAGTDPSALEALRRSLDGLHTLLPDLAPHWQELLRAHRKLIGVEALLRGMELPAESPTAVAALSGGAAPAGDPDRDLCMYSDAQRAAQQLQELAPFIREHGNRATDQGHAHASWVLTETLMGAARNYCGPGSTLLRHSDLQVAATAVTALRRSYEAHLAALIRLQVRLATKLPEVSLRLIELRTEMSDKDVNIGRLVATNLGLLSDLTVPR